VPTSITVLIFVILFIAIAVFLSYLPRVIGYAFNSQVFLKEQAFWIFSISGTVIIFIYILFAMRVIYI